MKTRLLMIHALSPIHCGTGQAVGGIDLPIAREKPTGIPLIPGSTIKGVLRASADSNDVLHRSAFGPPTNLASEHAGGIQISDANLVLLPVRSIRGTFAWVTSPYMLQRFARDAREAGLALQPLPAPPKENEALVTGDVLETNKKVIFEDFDFVARKDTDKHGKDLLKELAVQLAGWVFGKAPEGERDRNHMVDRVCVVHDDVMSLLLQTCMEITTRIKLDEETKTVDGGALWTEEALPVESVLSGLVVATPTSAKGAKPPEASTLLDYLERQTAASAIQLGGKASVGRGLCRLQLIHGKG